MEPAQRKDIAFSRDDFFVGGPSHEDGVPVEIRVEDGRSPRSAPLVLHTFTNMLVQSASQVDAERTQYLLSSNNTVKLYTFNRAVTALSLQMLLIDGDPRGVEYDDPVQFRQDAFEQFMWLYENELKMSQAVRRKRRIIVKIKDLDHEVLATQLTHGFASEAEWQVIANMELLFLSAEILNVGPSGVLKQGTDGNAVIATASRELLTQLGDLSVRENRSGNSTGGVARAVARTRSGVPTINQNLDVEG